MTHPLRDAVARAVFEADEARLAPAFRHHWDNILSQRQEEYRDRAGTAIAAFLDAVREPSEGMKHSGTEFLYGEDFIGNPKAVTTAVETWRAMIDALRAELLPPPGDG